MSPTRIPLNTASGRPRPSIGLEAPVEPDKEAVGKAAAVHRHPFAQAVGRCTVGRHTRREGRHVVSRTRNGRCVTAGRGGSTRGDRARTRIGRHDLSDARHACRRGRLDLRDHLFVASAQLRGRMGTPDGKRSQRHDRAPCEVSVPHVPPPTARAGHAIARDERRNQRHVADERGHRRRAWPVPRRRDQPLLHTLPGHVAEPVDHGGIVDHLDEARAPRPERSRPPTQPADLAPDTVVHVPLEPNELVTVLAREQEVAVVRQVAERVQRHGREQFLRARDRAEHDVAHLRIGPQEKPLLKRPGGGLVDGARAEPEQWTRHAAGLSIRRAHATP